VGLNVNAHFIGQDGTETGFDGTWMSALGFTWSKSNTVRSATITSKQVSLFIPTQGCSESVIFLQSSSTLGKEAEASLVPSSSKSIFASLKLESL
jgi:hypothetical protein